MADHDGSRETDPALGKSPPPSYADVQGYPPGTQGGPPPPGPGGPPPMDQGYPPQPYPQPYMQQGYHCAPGQAPPPGAKGPDMKDNPYPPAQGPYPPAQPGYPPASGAYPQGAYPQGPYPATAAPYGQPTASVVVTQPSGATVVVGQNPPSDNMLLSVLACFCCFCPTGIFAIMYSYQAKNANEVHDYPAAMRYANQAKKLAVASIIIGVCVMAIGIVLRLIVFTSAAHSPYD